MIGTAEYNLAKYIVKIINDAMPTTYMLGSTGSFVNQISSFDVKPFHVLVSYDVVYSQILLLMNLWILYAIMYANNIHHKNILRRLFKSSSNSNCMIFSL